QSSGGTADKLDLTLKFEAKIVRSLLWYYWHHPELVMRSQYKVPGVPSMSMTRLVTPEMRQQWPFEAVLSRVDPFSKQFLSPQQRLQIINEMVQRVVIPMQPLL